MGASVVYLGVAAGLATCALVVACSSSTTDSPPAMTASFTVVATNRNDSTPLAGAKPYAEIFLDDMHPARTVRFHFDDECTDSEESPHGHVAFFVKVS